MTRVALYGPPGAWKRSRGLEPSDILGNIDFGPAVVWTRQHGLTSDDVLAGYLGNLEIIGGSDSAFEIPGKPIQFKNGKLFPWKDGLGWNRARGNALDLFQQVQHRAPTADEKNTLARIVAFTRAAQKRGTGDSTAERDFENGWQRLSYFIRNGREARGPDLDAILAAGNAAFEAHLRAYYANKPKGWLGDFIHDVGSAVHTVTHAAASVYGAAGDALGKVPFVGEPLHAALNLAAGPIHLADAIANGDNISRTALSQLKDQLASAHTVSQYAGLITSAVPGIGQAVAGVDGALAAAYAISQGMPVTAALIDAAKSAALKALPGGAVVQRAASEAFEIGKALANGQSLDKIALDRARANLPPEAQRAFDVGLAVAQGKKAQEILTQGVLALAPKLSGDGAKLLAASPILSRAAIALSGPSREGFAIASGLLARQGVPPVAVAALRNRLTPAQRIGFDKAVSVHAKQFAAFRQV